ncbi:MAG: hypothetical protein AB7V13_17105 [Pseudorhodoplanes sp.]|uniref:hypothetical protein n=1 Tax=Pseudorhodoplanes sp. TaxID=1934341 RepID=UPI003D0B45DA
MRNWHKERRRGVVAATVAFLLGGLLSGYGVHSQMSHDAARALARERESAAAIQTALRTGAMLFVPQYGNVCRRRWIDNATWTLRDGGEIPCDEAVSWNAAVPARQHRVERRLDAIRNVFQSKAVGKLD